MGRGASLFLDCPHWTTYQTSCRFGSAKIDSDNWIKIQYCLIDRLEKIEEDNGWAIVKLFQEWELAKQAKGILHGTQTCVNLINSLHLCLTTLEAYYKYFSRHYNSRIISYECKVFTSLNAGSICCLVMATFVAEMCVAVWKIALKLFSSDNLTCSRS